MSLSSRISLILGTKSFTKENIVMVSGFGANSVILKDYIKYLEDFFNVYFIDLPGFVENRRSLITVSVDSYVSYIEKELKKVTWDKFFLGGLSFGFYVANKVKADSRCIGYFGIEPYIGESGLNLGKTKELVFGTLVKSVLQLGISSKIWNHEFFPKVLKLCADCSEEEVMEIVKGMDSEAYLKTAKLLLEEHNDIVFQEKPYALCINEKDTVINAPYVIEVFKKNVKDLFIIPTTADHFPKEITVSYFKKNIPSKKLYEAIAWANSLPKNKEEK